MPFLLRSTQVHMRLLLIAVCCLVGVACGAEPQAGTLILDESAYCRAYYQLDVQKLAPKAMKADGEKILGAKLLGRLEADVKKSLKSANLDWRKTDWRDHVTVQAQYNSFARKNRVFIRLGRITEPPADAWRRLDFDDRAWAHLRKPDGVGSPAQYTCGNLERNGWLRGIFLRFRFEIPDPATAKAVTFSADYIGGLRAFVNGKEIARGHLPAGDFDAATMTQGYPKEAYIVTFADLSKKEKARYKGRELPPTRVMRVADELTPLGSRLYQARNRSIKPVTIPPQLLRKGTNVLAIELRAAPLHPFVLKEWFGYRAVEDRQWAHARLSRLELRCASKDVPSSLKRPEGVQVWAEDMTRRMFVPEYIEPGAAPAAIRLAGARNGTYAAQVVVGADKPLINVKVTASELKNAAGGTIPSKALSVFGMNPQPMADISSLGEGRIVGSRMIEIGGGNSRYGDWTLPKARALVRFAPETQDDRKAAAAALQRIQYFDWIKAALPKRIGANSCQPYWLSVKIPANAAPGLYRGSVRVEGPGFPASTLPLEMEVLDLRLPDPRDFQTIVAIEQSPYGVAKQYKTPLWSARHWELIEASLRQLGRAGNSVWIIPVLADTEFGNKDDSTIKWIRKKDGSLAFDYAALDRYLDLIVKTCGTPRVLSFVVMHGFAANVEVKVLNEATGKKERLNLGPNAPGREKYWRPFAASLYSHMLAKGLDRAMFWGYGWDQDGDPKLKGLLRQFTPEVFWMCGSHDANVAVPIGKPDPAFTAIYKTTYYSAYWKGIETTGTDVFYKVVENIQSFLIGGKAQQGWKPRVQVLLCTPRTDSGAIVVNGTGTPLAFRILPERAIFSGYRGTGRMGGDYWARSYHDGCRHRGGAPGFSIMKCLWPGPDGAESSGRFEAMIEGLQELEARIFVEQTLDRGILPAGQAKRITKQLARHYKGTFAGGQDWQARSKMMYQLASDVARVVGMDVAESDFAITLEAKAKTSLRLKLRNWTNKPRKWKAASSVKWIVPARAGGTANGIEDLEVRVRGDLRDSEKRSDGVLTITDVASGRAYLVKIAVTTPR